VLGGSGAKVVSLYFAEEDTLWLIPENRVIEEKNIALAVMNALLAGPTQDGLISLIAEDVSVLSLEIKNKAAYLDLSPEFNNVNYGSGPEASMLGMIVNTLTELQGIEVVFITVQGNIPECFRHIGSSGPFIWDDNLLKKFRAGNQ